MRNKKKKGNYNWLVVFCAVIVVLFDLYFQYWGKANGFGVENRGISFGIGDDYGEYFRFSIPLLVLFVFGWMLVKKDSGNIFLWVLLIGGLGNMIPRVLWGHVWDYLYVPLVDLWINLSDVVISTATLSYILVDNDRDTSCL